VAEQVLAARGGDPAVERAAVRSRRRVLYLMVRPHPELYGGTRSLLMFLEGQDAVDAYVVVAAASPDDPALAELTRLGIPHEYFPAGELLASRQRWSTLARFHRVALMARFQRGALTARCNRAMLRVIRRVRPDVVHADFEGMTLIAPAALLAGCRLVQHLRGAQASGRLGAVLEAGMFLADRTVVVAESLRQECAALLPPVIRRRVLPRLVAVPNGIPLDQVGRYLAEVSREEARAALGIPPDELAIGLVGGIFGHKGQREFLEATAPRVAAADPRVHFYLVGGVKDEAYARGCREAAGCRGLAGRVTFTGWQDDVYRWYRALDVMALPSFAEGFGRAVAESQAFGVPVVASDIAGIRDTMEHGVGGFFARTPGEFAGYLESLAADPALRAEMGRRGREFVSRFDVASVTRQMELIYDELDGGRR
jgi:glycosyltransferase involved in cell wall biosynthesis